MEKNPKLHRGAPNGQTPWYMALVLDFLQKLLHQKVESSAMYLFVRMNSKETQNKKER
jgi:hypothetical protein